MDYLFTRFRSLFRPLRLGRVHSYALDADLHEALQELARREQRSPQELQSDLLRRALAARFSNDDLGRSWEALSPREQQVTALACQGLTNRQIAARLGVAEETVKTHVKNTLVKFGLHGKVELRMALADWDFSGWK